MSAMLSWLQLWAASCDRNDNEEEKEGGRVLALNIRPSASSGKFFLKTVRFSREGCLMFPVGPACQIFVFHPN